MTTDVERGEVPRISPRTARWFFGFFFASGFCSILYELIWLRLSMAQFGVTTATVSIVLSCFMAGLGLGSWLAGSLIRRNAAIRQRHPLSLYATVELLIGCSAVLLPLELSLGRWVLEGLGSSVSLSSAEYYVAAGLWLALTFVPWCACMGATFPVGMLAIQTLSRSDSPRSFSFLYVANVLGAVLGALVPLLVVELVGFSGTLKVGMLFNFCIAVAALRLAQNTKLATDREPQNPVGDTGTAANFRDAHSGYLWLLFFTGLTSMGMEIVWVRLYTAFVGTFVYSFAMILAAYLAATFLGSTIYRVWSSKHRIGTTSLWPLVWLAALVPLLTADKEVLVSTSLRVPLGIVGFSALLGFLTPMLVDRFSNGDPKRAGAGYAVNIIGCILGPLVGGFALLPTLGERYSLVALASPWLVLSVAMLLRRPAQSERLPALRWVTASVALAASAVLIVSTKSYVEETPNAQVRRDSTATVIAIGEGMSRRLLVNGVSMTVLSPVTKMMAAMPLALLDEPPHDALVICFGMGTTHRSMLTWGINSTVVDLVPSVPALFWYFHADAEQVFSSPRSRVVIDDGRRFLERTSEQYDVIVIDPPPPIGAAGSSLLYSREFYATALKRLRPDGIVQQWYPGGDKTTTAAVARALNESFPHVRAFVSFGGWGIHFLASRKPIPDLSAAEMAAKLPPDAAADLVEWGPFETPEEQFDEILKNEASVETLIASDRTAPAIQDDRPINEYYLLRSHFPGK